MPEHQQHYFSLVTRKRYNDIMSSNSHLSPVPVVRSDGVSTTVWKRGDKPVVSPRAASAMMPKSSVAADVIEEWNNHRNPRMTALVKKLKSRGDTNPYFHVLVHNTSGEVRLSDAADAEAIRVYRRGACVTFAYIASIATGHPVALFTDDSVPGSWSGHAALALPSGDVFDIEGIMSVDAIGSYFGNMAMTTDVLSPTDAHTVMGGSTLNADGITGHLLSHVNELGILVTAHFVRQLLDEDGIDYDEAALSAVEKMATARARSKA